MTITLDEQGVKKVSFTAWYSGKMSLALNSPKICFDEQHWLQFFCDLNFPQKFTCLLAKLHVRTEFISPVLLDTPFVACWQIHLSPHEMLLGESTFGIKHPDAIKNKLMWSFPNHLLNSNGDNNDGTYTVNYSNWGLPCNWKLACVITRVLGCEFSCFSSLPTSLSCLASETSAVKSKKFHTDDLNHSLHYSCGSHWFPELM